MERNSAPRALPSEVEELLDLPNPKLANNSESSENNSEYSDDSEEYYSDESAITFIDLNSIPSLENLDQLDQDLDPNRESPIINGSPANQSPPKPKGIEPHPETKSTPKKTPRVSWKKIARNQQTMINKLMTLLTSKAEQGQEQNSVDPNLTAYQPPDPKRKVVFNPPPTGKSTPRTPAPKSKTLPKQVDPVTYSTPYKSNPNDVTVDINEPFIEIGLDEHTKFPSSVSGLEEFSGEQGEPFSSWWSHFKRISARWSNTMRVNVILAKFGRVPKAWLLNVLENPITYSNLVIEIERAYSTLNSDVEIRQSMRKLKWDSNVKKSAASWLGKLEALKIKLLDDCVPARNKMYLSDADSYRDYLTFRAELLQHEIKWGQFLDEQRNDRPPQKGHNNNNQRGQTPVANQVTASASTPTPTPTPTPSTPKTGTSSTATAEVTPVTHPDITCHYCKQKGHYKSNCPKKRRALFARASDPGPDEESSEDEKSSSDDSDSSGTVQGSPGSSVAIEPVDINSTEPAFTSASQLTQALFSGDGDTDPTLLYRQVPVMTVPRTAWMVDLIDTDDFGTPVRFTTQQLIPTVNTATVPDFPFAVDPAPQPSQELLIQFDDSPPRDVPNNTNVFLPDVGAVTSAAPTLLPSPLKDVVIGSAQDRFKTVTPAETTVVIGENPFKCLIDTGANISLITAAALQLLPVDSFEVLPASDSFTVGNNESVSLYGAVYLPVAMCGTVVSIRFEIVESFENYDVVVGLDEIVRLNMDLCLPLQYFTVPGGSPQLLSFGSDLRYTIPAISHVPGPFADRQLLAPSCTTPVKVRLAVVVPSSMYFKIVKPCCRDVIELTSDLMQGNDSQFYEIDAKNPALTRVHLLNGVRIADVEIVSSHQPLFKREEKSSDIQHDPVNNAIHASKIQENQQPESGSESESTSEDSQEIPKSAFGLKIGNLTTEQRAKLDHLIGRFAPIFEDPKKWGANIRVQHQIKLKPGTQPIRIPPRRVPLAQQPSLDSEINELLKKGIICKSTSPWAAPIVLVKKKDDTWRICIDFRLVNKETEGDGYSMPRMDASLDGMAKSKVRSSFDLRKGYFQLPLQEDDIEKTAFVVPSGHYEFVYLPFGLTNAPATFQRAMDDLFREELFKFLIVYLDDIIVFSDSFEQHLEHLEIVFKKLQDANLYLNPEKCQLVQERINYLGHVISSKGIETNGDKTEAIRAMEPPRNLKQLRSFLGMAGYYRRFIRDFATLADPLHKLLKKDKDWEWNDQCRYAFLELKNRLSSAPILAFPHTDKPFILQTDASNTGLGAVLAQVQDGEERVIAYYSRSLLPAERNYHTTDLECLAVVAALKHFRCYLLGSEFEVFTDHSALTTFLTRRQTSSKLLRWALELAEFGVFKINHRPGTQNGNADGLSRLGKEREDNAPVNFAAFRKPNAMKLLVLHGTKNRPSTVQLDYVNLAQLQREDIWLNHMYEYIINDKLPVEPELARDIAAQRSLYVIENNVLHRIFSVESSHRRHETRKLVAVPRSHIDTVLTSMHCNIEGSHLGIDRTYEKIRLHFHWPTMYTDIRRFVKECATCAKKKPPVRPPVGHLMPIRAQGAWDIVGVDVLGPLPITQSKHRYVVVFTDYLTKWVEAFPIREADSQTIARLFVMEIITRFGAPRKLISDRGTVFMSELSTAIYDFMNIKKMFTTPYHPQTDGLTERFNKTAAQMLTAYVNENQTNWDQILPLSLLAYRTARQSSTRETPFFMTYGRDAFLPLNRIFPSELDDEITESEYTAKLLENLKSAYRTADINETTAKNAQERNHNIGRVPITFEVNSLVWYYSPKRVKNQVQKLSPLWTGPFIVSQQLSPTVYLLENIDTGKKFAANIQRIKPSNISIAQPKKIR